uniref:Proline-serine-threonine phosphatase-interacting protein 2-like n=1 Tax=Saccoglossus kowalevskii TaxID=10224 RepID=A0ABM0MCS8_SACKO
MHAAAEIEKSYGSKLTRLAKNPGGKDEIGSMKQSWEQFVCQTEKIGEAHIAMSQVLLEEVKHIREFRDLQREKRKKIEDVILESQRQKKDTYNKTMTLKKSYDRNCREADNAEDLALKSRLTANAKEQEKLNLSKERKKTQAEQADQAYQRSIEHLEEIRKKWEKDFTQGCVIFQSLEEERIQFLRNALWIQTNIGSSYCCKEDQYYEDVRKLLEICDETKDIQQFIKNSNTGKVPPAPMQYENYYLPKINSKSAGRVGSIMKTQTSIGRRPQEPLPSSVVSTLRGTSTVATRGPPPLPVQNNSMDFEDDPAYASVSDKTEKLVKALYAYEAQ